MFCDFYGTRNTRSAKIAKRLAVKNGGQLKRSGAQVEFMVFKFPGITVAAFFCSSISAA